MLCKFDYLIILRFYYTTLFLKFYVTEVVTYSVFYNEFPSKWDVQPLPFCLTIVKKCSPDRTESFEIQYNFLAQIVLEKTPRLVFFAS